MLKVDKEASGMSYHINQSTGKSRLHSESMDMAQSFMVTDLHCGILRSPPKVAPYLVIETTLLV